MVEQIKNTEISKQQLIDYFRNNISYRLDSEKRDGMQLFLKEAVEYEKLITR